jgi:anaphase-promoting complex subunit 4
MLEGTQLDNARFNKNVKQNDLAHLDRNLDALIQELATRCQKIFLRGAIAATRSADVKWGQDPAFRAKTTFSAELMNPLVVRERIIKPDDRVSAMLF